MRGRQKALLFQFFNVLWVYFSCRWIRCGNVGLKVYLGAVKITLFVYHFG